MNTVNLNLQHTSMRSQDIRNDLSAESQCKIPHLTDAERKERKAQGKPSFWCPSCCYGWVGKI